MRPHIFYSLVDFVYMFVFPRSDTIALEDSNLHHRDFRTRDTVKNNNKLTLIAIFENIKILI